MNVTRIAILSVAAIAAGAAALLVRGMLGGGTAAVEASAPPPPAVTDVLVASKPVAPGRVLEVDAVRWESWPNGSVLNTFITRNTQPDLGKAIEGMVARSPLVVGQPITDANVVKTDSKGFMAATLTPGMRAIATPITVDTAVGGFLLPNDRVDVILTHDVSAGEGPKAFVADTILRDVRLLGIDQTSQPKGDEQSQVGRTATLELTPSQAELLQMAHAAGTLSLTLRALGDSSDQTLASNPGSRQGKAPNAFTIIRYGVVRGVDKLAGGR